MSRALIAGLACALLLAVVAPRVSAAAESTPAQRVRELVDLVRRGSATEKAEEKQRLREFSERKQEQQALLQQAIARRGALQGEAEALDRAFDANELRITGLEEQLRERQGNLDELFGVVKQNAEDLRGRISESLVSAELPGREAFLNDLVRKRDVELPTLEELRTLWATLLEEIAESGRVSRFSAPVDTLDQGIQQLEVVRVGDFNLVAADRYLRFDFESGRIAELAAQPPRARTASTAALLNAESGFVGFAIDPSRGQILGTYLQVPSLVDRFQQGGFIGYTIAALGIGGLLAALWRWVVLRSTGRKVDRQTRDTDAHEDNPLGRVLATYQENQELELEIVERKLEEAILKEVPQVEIALGMIRMIAIVAPLMGLLGTVTGMINTFQAITLFGTGDPQVMAGGISQALVTTVLGLTVAIPLTLLHVVVSSRADRIVHQLEQQAAGIVALHAEKHGVGV